MERRFREARPVERRISSQRTPRPEIIIVCEGKVTEPEYFKQLSTLWGNSLVRVRTIGGCGVPISVVERAIDERRALALRARKTRDSFDEVFEVWAAFDRDAHPDGYPRQCV